MLGRTLRVVALALLGSLLFGFLVGTWLRWRLERPVTYLGQAGSTVGAAPLQVGYTGAVVFDPRHHEEQIG